MMHIRTFTHLERTLSVSTDVKLPPELLIKASSVKLVEPIGQGMYCIAAIYRGIYITFWFTFKHLHANL